MPSLHIYHHYPRDEARHQEILALLRHLVRQGDRLMAKIDDMRADLEEANTTTNEIAEDVDILVAKALAGGLTPEETDEIQAKVAALKVRLQGVAAKYTPDAPTP